MIRWLVLAMLLVAGGASAQQRPIYGPSMRNLVVMLEVRGDSGGPACAAGLIVSQAPDRVLILTAAHVLQKPAEELDQDPATLRTTAEFGWAPGKLLPAKVVPNIKGADLDYMLFSVEGAEVPVLPDLSILAALPNGDDEIGEGTGVIEVGNPSCHRWEHGATPAPIVASGGAEIRAESRMATEGSSGGGLFSADGALVGLVQSSGKGFVTARPIGLLVGELRRQGIKIDLSERAYGRRQAVASEASGPSQAAQFGKRPIKAEFAGLGDGGYSFNVLPAPGYQNVKEIRLSGASEVVLRRRDTSGDFTMSARKAMTETLYATVVFTDGSAAPRAVLDLRSIVEARMAKMEEDPRDWVTCDLVEHSCRLFLRDEYRAFIERVDMGFSPTALDWRLLPLAKGSPRGLKDLLSEDSLVLPMSSDGLSYQITFVGGRVTPLRRAAFIDRDCGNCRRQKPYLAKAQTQGAPVVAYMFTPAFPQAVGDYLQIAFPPALAQASVEMDPDGRGLLPFKGGSLLDPPETMAFRFTLPSGERIGPFTYRFDYAAPTVAAAVGAFSIACQAQSDGKELCAISAPQVLHKVKQIRIGLDPGKFSIFLNPAVTPADLADRRWRQRISRCYGAFYNQQCTEAWRAIKGATFEIPPAATDLYVEMDYRDGTSSEVVRIPHPPRT